MSPWFRVLEGARFLLVRGRVGWAGLSSGEREELARLTRLSRGRPTNLTARERAELGRIVRKGLKAAAALDQARYGALWPTSQSTGRR
jgi:hypothetical protein